MIRIATTHSPAHDLTDKGDAQIAEADSNCEVAGVSEACGSMRHGIEVEAFEGACEEAAALDSRGHRSADGSLCGFCDAVLGYGAVAVC